MSAEITIRPAKPTDRFDPMVEMIVRATLQTVPSVLMDGLTRSALTPTKLSVLSTSPGHELFIAEYSFTPVGIVRLRARPGRAANAPAWYREEGIFAFDLLVVEPAMQDLGVGRALLQRLEQRTHELEAAELACDLPKAACSTIAMFRGQGFRPVDTFRSGSGETRIVLSRGVLPQQQAA